MGWRVQPASCNLACRLFQDKEQVEGLQTLLGPDFKGGEIHGSQHLPMPCQECLPGGVLSPARGRFNSMLFEDILNSGGRKLVPQIGQGSLDPIIAPGQILLCDLDDKANDFFSSTRPAGCLSLGAIVPFLGD